MAQPHQPNIIDRNIPPPENLNRPIRPENEQIRIYNAPREHYEVRQNYGATSVHRKIHEWGLSRGPTTVEDFIFRVEYLQNHYQCPWAEVLRDFHRLLKGEAIEW